MKTQQQKVDEANLAGQKASEVTGVPFTAGTIETYFPQPEKKTEPLPTTPSPYYPRYTEQEQQATDILSQPMDTESTEEIQARKMKQAQGQIDALNRLYATKLAEQRDINVGQERRTASVSTLTGLAGSTEAGVQARKTEKLGEKQLGAIQQEQAVMIQSILSDVSKSAVQEARYQSEESRKSAREILDLRTQRQEKVIRDLSIMGQTGATIEGLRAEMPAEDFDYLVRNAGGEEMLKRNLSLNRPVESIVSEITSGGSHFITWQNPITGDIRTDEIPLNIPTEYTEKADLGDQLMFFPKGSPQEAIFINKTSSPKDIAELDYKRAQTAKIWGEMTGGGEAGYIEGGYPSDVRFTVAGKIDIEKLPNLGGKRITDKSARQANLPFGITDKQASWIEQHRPGNKQFQALAAISETNFTKGFGALAGLFELREDIAEIRALKEKVNTGWTGTQLKKGQRFTGWETGRINDFSLLEQKTGKELVRFIKSISGVAVSDNERKMLTDYIMNVKMQDKQFNSSLNDYEDDLNQVILNKIMQYDFENEAELREALLGPMGSEEEFLTATGNQIKSPDGTQFINIADLTPEELEEAKNAGWR